MTEVSIFLLAVSWRMLSAPRAVYFSKASSMVFAAALSISLLLMYYYLRLTQNNLLLINSTD